MSTATTRHPTVIRSRRDDGSEHTTLVTADGVVAAAVVHRDGAAVRLHVDVAGGHRPPDAGRVLLDAVFAALEPGPPRPVHASVPLGAPDLLAALRDRLVDIETRPAGATCLIEATLPGGTS